MNIVPVISGRIGRPSGRPGSRADRPWWNCPFHEDHNPSFTVQPDGEHFKCFGCGASGDAIDFIRRMEPQLGYIEARDLLGQPATRPTAGPKPLRTMGPKHKAKPPAGPSPDWRRHADSIVRRSVQWLDSADGDRARAWLNARGLADETIAAAEIGYNPTDAEIHGHFIARGIVIPWRSGPDATIEFVTVRRPRGEPKFQAIKGGYRTGLYPHAQAIRPGCPVVIVEGEFDALLLGQVIRPLGVPVVTLGPASGRLDARTIEALTPASMWLVATDADKAGEEAAQHLAIVSDRVRRVLPPDAKDWTDAHKAGADLLGLWSEVLGQVADEQLAALDEDERDALAERAAIFAADSDLPDSAASWKALQLIGA